MSKNNNEQDNCCYNCAYFYDIDSNGIGKCERAHGGITDMDNVCTCHLHILDDLRAHISEDEDE